MATKKKTTERATTSRERKLALALRAVLDQSTHDSAEYGTAEADAVAVLSELGYGSLQSIPLRLKTLNAALTAAVAASDYKEVTRLGIELERAKAGKSSPVKPAAPVAKKSSRRGRQQAPAANIETETAIASTAGGNANGSDAASA